MPAFLHHIATGTPAHRYHQTETRDRLKSWARDPKTKRLIHAIYGRSGIETRHSVCADFGSGAEGTLYQTAADGAVISPGTAERNAVYARESHRLSVELAARAIDEAPGFGREDITHIVFASCTGFTNPGPDYHIIRELGLRHNIERYTLGFMGCYAAFPALRMAAHFCQANPNAVVLVMCLELCTLHMQINDETDSILANSLFADGAAAAIVSAQEPQPGTHAFKLSGFESALLPAGESDMAWDIGNEGFNIVLSSYVPDIIGANIEALMVDVLGKNGSTLGNVDEWAVHPGGRSILDKVETSLGLGTEALESSRAVLRDYGNMSSATILFVLREMLDSGETPRATTCAMAFGPGLTVETALLERIDGPVPKMDSKARELVATV